MCRLPDAFILCALLGTQIACFLNQPAGAADTMLENGLQTDLPTGLAIFADGNAHDHEPTQRQRHETSRQRATLHECTDHLPTQGWWRDARHRGKVRCEPCHWYCLP